MERWWLFAAGFFFLLSFGGGVFALGAGVSQPGRFQFAAIAAGFCCQSAFLYLRGQATRACPLGTQSDLLVFLAWATVLIYLVIGPAYRLSLMGIFTSPLVLLLQLAALPVWEKALPARPMPPGPWPELHASLAVTAYGAFGLAAVSGLMYLLQERFLKRRRLSNLFFHLPPIQDLAKATGRLLALGFGLFTGAFAAGLLSHQHVDVWRFGASVFLWGLYGAVLFLRGRRRLAPHRMAACSIGIFVFAILALPAIHYLAPSVP